jgi:hypothetical protein
MTNTLSVTTTKGICVEPFSVPAAGLHFFAAHIHQAFRSSSVQAKEIKALVPGIRPIFNVVKYAKRPISTIAQIIVTPIKPVFNLS